LLAFATGTDLEAVVANYGITRLLVSAATTDTAAVYETDDALRYRASLVFDSLSVAGPTSAYEYHALSSDGQVADAKAYSPAPAEAVVVILQNNSNDGAATQNLINTVYNYLSDDTRRPVADRLTVESVVPVNFELSATIHTHNYPEADPLIQAASEAVQNYLNENRRIGRSIYLSKLYNILHVAGVVHVDITSPTDDIHINRDQVAYCTAINIEAGAA